MTMGFNLPQGVVIDLRFFFRNDNGDVIELANVALDKIPDNAVESLNKLIEVYATKLLLTEYGPWTPMTTTEIDEYLSKVEAEGIELDEMKLNEMKLTL